MKLRNKKTGEIVAPYLEWCSNSNKPHSLAELNEEWEDYEEPKNYWMIDGHGEAHEIFVDSSYISDEKEIGNYFETKEEAKRAVEKLKAWKRLKDNNLGELLKVEFENCLIEEGKKVTFSIYAANKKTTEDLQLLFGGEE